MLSFLNVAAHGLNRLVPTHITHPENRLPGSSSGCGEAAAQRVPGELLFIQASNARIGFDDVGDRSIREPIGAHRAGFVDRSERRPGLDASRIEPFPQSSDLRTKTVVSATEVTGAGGLSMLFSSLTFLFGFCFSSYLSLGALATNLIVDHRENAVDESLTFSVGLERASIFPE
ncbi:hypothetical protein JQ582_41225 [Bradyrhizobium japonicum]|uniref:hypothetical protein n=1 Tax=Bradyrhizobium japonicum TaxID=375 RepID=UPI001BADD4AA|nr:hypothetical protein [Bradyrhizobium japonicum]MBR0750333.1 hypothetical protein [Bradyrhizobium japonicum]